MPAVLDTAASAVAASTVDGLLVLGLVLALAGWLRSRSARSWNP